MINRAEPVCKGDTFMALLLVGPTQRQPIFIFQPLGKDNLAIHQPRDEIEIGLHLEMSRHELLLIHAFTFGRPVGGLSG